MPCRVTSAPAGGIDTVVCQESNCLNDMMLLNMHINVCDRRYNCVFAQLKGATVTVDIDLGDTVCVTIFSSLGVRV